MNVRIEDDEFSLPARPFEPPEAVEELPPERSSHATLRADTQRIDAGGTPHEDVPSPIALVYPSRSGGGPHVVTVLEMADGSRAVFCICAAMRSLNIRPQGCWAMQNARRLVGIPPL